MFSNTTQPNRDQLPLGYEGSINLATETSNRINVLKVLSQTILRELDSFGFEQISKTKENLDLAEEVRKFETDLICRALIRAKGRQRLAAKLLNVKITTLNAKIKRYGINPNGL